MKDQDETRRSSTVSSPKTRKSSLASLSLRLTRSKSKAESSGNGGPSASMNKSSLEAFFAMPNEIQVEILCFLEPRDILSLRIASKELAHILMINVSVLTRRLMKNSWLGDDPIYLGKLYPLPSPIKNYDFFLQMLHLQTVVTKTLDAIGFYIQRKFYRIKTEKAVRAFAPGRKRLEARLVKPAVMVYHFLESYRARLSSGGDIRSDDILEFGTYRPPRIQAFDHSVQTELLTGYSFEELMPAFNFYRIMVSCYRQKLRPPPYAGTLERKLRGCSEEPPGDMQVIGLLLYGCMDEVQKILVMGNYNSRVRAFDSALDWLYNRAEDAETKKTKNSDAAEQEELEVQRDITKPPIPPMSANFVDRIPRDTDSKLTDLYFPWLKAFQAVAGDTVGGFPEVLDLIENPFDMVGDLIKENVVSRFNLEEPNSTVDEAAEDEEGEGGVDDVIQTPYGTPFTHQLFPSTLPGGYL